MTPNSARLQGERLARFFAGPWSIVVVLLLAFALRTINLSGRPVWYDEAFAVLYAEKPFETMLYGTVTQVEGAAADVHPLFFYSTLHVWMELVGQSPVAVRSLSVLLGTATVAMVYRLARQLFDRRIAMLAALIAALAPFHVYYSQEARMYSLLGFAAISAAFFFVRAWTRGRWLDWLAFGVFGALTLYAHNLGFAFILGLDLWVLWSWFRPGGRRWQNLRPLILSHLLMLILFAPWLAILPSQFGKIQQAYWVQRPDLTTIVQTLLVFHFGYDNQALPGWLLPPALFLSLLIPALLALRLIRARAPRRWSLAYILLLLLAISPPLIVLVLSQIRPVYIVRAFLPSALAYYALVAGVLGVRTVPRAIRWALLLSAMAIAVASLVNHYTYALFPRPRFDEAAAYLRTNYQPGDAIVHSNKLTFLPAHYYDRSLPQAFIADEPGSPSDTLAYPTQQALGLYATPDLATATKGHERVWLVIFQRAIDEYLALGYDDHPHRDWLEQHCVRASKAAFNDLDVYEYHTCADLESSSHRSAVRNQ
jgi:4-amino-4-deoxy-L-arabinose transferase-like glycosyltransferase